MCIPYTSLGEADKTSGQIRALGLPRFLDLSGLTSDNVGCLEILYQSLRNVLYTLVDYERFRHDFPLEDEKGLPVLVPALAPSDEMRPEALLRIVRKYIERRDSKLLPACDRASTLFAKFPADSCVCSFPEALDTYQQILECFRFPHVILVDEVEDTEASTKASKTRARYSLTARRLWNRQHRVLELETLEPLDAGEYYYLRPTWNTRLGARYPLNRGERIGRARAARWVDAFWKGIFSPSKADATDFAHWILQFAPSERRFAALLFDALDVYDDERIRTEWVKAYQQLPVTAKRDVAFIGLGHAAKSGRSLVYSFRQAIARLPEYQTVYGGREKSIFRDLAEFASDSGGLVRPSTFVFVDDFIGTGGQASDFIRWYFRRKEFHFLKESDVFLLVLTGFESAIKEVVSVLRSEVHRPHSVGVIAAQPLREDDRAFADSSPIWHDALETRRAMEWAAQLGQELLASDPARDGKGQALYDPHRDALGWHGCQALVSFHYNIPSDTLPMFWSGGSRRGTPWVPLQRRSD